MGHYQWQQQHTREEKVIESRYNPSIVWGNLNLNLSRNLNLYLYLCARVYLSVWLQSVAIFHSIVAKAHKHPHVATTMADVLI